MLGDNIKNIREEKKLGLNETARLAGISQRLEQHFYNFFYILLTSYVLQNIGKCTFLYFYIFPHIFI